MYKFSRRSAREMKGVKRPLIDVCYRAIEVTTIDFGIIDGLRTEEEQAELLRSGATQTMKSKHLTGDAVDVLAYVGSRGSWELELYFAIAEAMAQAAKELNIPIRWGGAWHCDNIAEYTGSMEELLYEYVEFRRSQGQRPFIDAGHFELNYPITDEELHCT